MRRVALYFDFVSPYSWLALASASAFGRKHGVEWDLVPVVYGAILDATGLRGPAEVEVKRRHLFRDVERCAERSGLPLVGPPAHPFRSLDALRAVCLFRGDPRCTDLAIELARACWELGKDLTDLEVIGACVARVGLDASDLAAGTRAQADSLRQLTAGALEAGVFGVPTFAWNGELFWGHDRMDHLAARLDGALPPAGALTRELLGRPRGIDRKGR